MDRIQPLTRDLFAALAAAPGHIRTSGRIIDGRPFIIIHHNPLETLK